MTHSAHTSEIHQPTLMADGLSAIRQIWNFTYWDENLHMDLWMQRKIAGESGKS